MHAKKRKNRINLYRSAYVRKGASGNTHGYAAATFVGSLPVDSLEIPPLLAKKLTAEECQYVERVVLEPALRAMEDKQREAQERERDPGWRIDEALRLLAEASDRIGEGRDVGRSGSLVRLSQLVTDIARDAGFSGTTADNGKVDPLKGVLAALERAAQAVRDGHYGHAPELGVQSTDVYRAWSAITAAVGGGEDSLLRALQRRGWVKVRGTASR